MKVKKEKLLSSLFTISDALKWTEIITVFISKPHPKTETVILLDAL